MIREPFGLKGSPPALEYVCNFINQYLHLRASSNNLSKAKLGEADIDHLIKSAWFAFDAQMTPEEYINVIAKAYKNMPNGKRFILPHQLSTHFANNVAEVERIVEEIGD